MLHDMWSGEYLDCRSDGGLNTSSPIQSVSVDLSRWSKVSEIVFWLVLTFVAQNWGDVETSLGGSATTAETKDNVITNITNRRMFIQSLGG